MSTRVEYEMSKEDLAYLQSASQPVPYMVFGGMEPRGPQENANQAWAALGAKMGFDSKTARPIPGKPRTFFSAMPTTTTDGGK